MTLDFAVADSCCNLILVEVTGRLFLYFAGHGKTAAYESLLLGTRSMNARAGSLKMYFAGNQQLPLYSVRLG